MHNSIISQIKNHPILFVLSVGLHLLLVVILIFNMAPSVPKMPAAEKVDTVKAVIIDASVVEKEKQKLIRAEQKKQDKQLAQKNRLDRDAKKARDKRKKEEKRLAKLKNDEKKRKQKLARKEKAEKEKKKNELAKLKKQKEKLKQEQKELEKKRRDEQQKLAAIESKRKAEEAAERKKRLDEKLAAEAEVRRQAQDAEMRRQMLEEERRLAKRSAENQKLLAQYIYQIQRKVEINWNAPASMTSGWSCEIMVEQNRFGEVQNVRTKQCSGSDAFKSTVERAVRKASPLPEAPNNDVFEKKLNFIFRPDV
ncbi:MAG: cell envelope integrity protein TolA [endosymbiont of Galathealinum brachiosum]|uniref:Cell envelope integrity protein TolA n=1 Tax=endosymbiont of Galathealinum brachiosum TaxID=2200906 RepID=A0A370DL88_9GAMM|nr:MAG: cell envelope integrity protein TolA [endosymbiont of Galathealinum brachiosum]